MDTLLHWFLRLVTLPGKIHLTSALRVLSFITGVAVLYLLTLRRDEEGKVEDFIRRVWNRVYQLRNRALSRHVAFLRVTASTLTAIADKLFGPRLISVEAIGVSVSLSLILLNLYFFVKGSSADSGLDHVFNITILLSFALFPAVLRAFWPARRKRRKSQLVRNQLLLSIWMLGLLLFATQEYLSPLLFCATCLPPQLAQFRGFLFGIMSMLFGVALVGAVLFTSFIIVSRFALRRLSATDSAWKAIGFLLIGCTPILVFWGLLKGWLFLLNHTEIGSQTPTDTGDVPNFSAQEWLTIGYLIVFMLSFFTNVAFLVTPILFFTMALLLLVHRLLWPAIERPLELLNRTRFLEHRKTIVAVGLLLILFAIGKLEWLEKLLKLRG